VERYDRLRTQKVDPRLDNALNITTDGRKLASMPGCSPKQHRTSPTRRSTPPWKTSRRLATPAGNRGTQMIFCDMGVNPTAWGYSSYDEITEKLVRSGIPRKQIAAIGDADSDAKKQALFDKVRSGSIRVLIGSTQKMGTAPTCKNDWLPCIIWTRRGNRRK